MIKTLIKWFIFRITYIDPVLLELKVMDAIYKDKIKRMEKERDELKNKVLSLKKAHDQTQALIKKYSY